MYTDTQAHTNYRYWHKMHFDNTMLCGQYCYWFGDHNAASWFVPELLSTWDTVSVLLDEDSQHLHSCAHYCMMIQEDSAVKGLLVLCRNLANNPLKTLTVGMFEGLSGLQSL